MDARETTLVDRLKVREAYTRDGYVVVPGVLSADQLHQLQAASDRLILRLREARSNTNFMPPGRWLNEEQRAALDIDGVHDPQYHDGSFSRALGTIDAALDAAEAVLGPNIQLHHTKLIVKPPERGAPFPMHQDAPYFPHENHSPLAIAIQLDDANESNGCLRFYPGSHQLGLLPVQPDGTYLDPAKFPLSGAVQCPTLAGDAVLFSCLTIHGSDRNRSERPRRYWIVQVRDPLDEPAPGIHASRGQGMMLRGIDPKMRLTFER